MSTAVVPRVPGRPEPARRADDAAPELTERSSLAELAAAVPGLRDELVDRARSVGLLVGWVAVIAAPAWTIVDRITAPAQAGAFLAIRLLADVPMLACMYALWRRPIGRRRPEALTYAILALVQLEVAWFIPRVDDAQFHLLGFTLAIYGSGGVLVARPRWTVRLIVVSWAALAASMLTAPTLLSRDDLVSSVIYLGTASVVALLAHQRRYALSQRELATRVRLEREQERNRGLLAQLERLSQEDPLTGLANRRRWDGELAAACASARERGGEVSVVRLDIDRFKGVNDRHGHAGGDEALRAVAALLRGAVRDGDLVARLGGDELAVLLPGTDGERAVALAETLRAATELLAPDGFVPGELTLSLGVATARDAAAFPIELIAQADQQLYRAKITRNAVGAPGSTPAPRVPVPRPAPAG
jgi:diguanylate cyclase (GGDEF)-like protein